MKVFLFVIFSTLLIPTLSDYISAETDGSFEVINLNDAEELSYIANLQIDFADLSSKNKTLYFTSERGASNVYIANFVIGGGPETFICDGNSPYASAELPPFLSFVVTGSNVIGPVFSIPPYGIQNVVINNNIVSSSITSYLQYNFVSILVNPIVDPVSGLSVVYLAGWNPSRTVNSFVIARTNVTLGASGNLSPLNDYDVLYLPTGDCYDLYDEKKHPDLFFATGGYLIVSITGRCASFSRIHLGSGLMFNQSTFDFIDPTEGVAYVPSAAFNNDTSVIYYTLKSFNAPTAFIYSFDTKSTPWNNDQLQEQMDLVDLERDTELIIVFAKSTIASFIVIIGSGSDRVERYTISTDGSLDGDSQASTLLEDEVNTVYTALYYDPYIYFSTYEPDAKLARLNINNFCSLWCSTSGYCLSESCTCKRGYVNDDIEGCIAADNENNPSSDQSKVLGLAILSGVAVVVAIIGWALWFRSRNSYEQIR